MLTGIILAAGEGKRIGCPKALLTYRKKTFLEIIATRMQKAGLEDIIVVLGFNAPKIISTLSLEKIKIVINPDYKRGQLSSLKTALSALAPENEGILLTLVDHPLVKISTYRSLIQASQKYPDKIIIPEFSGKGGHPVIFAAKFIPQLLAAPLDQGARLVVYNNFDQVVRFKMNDPAIRQDIDTQTDYQKLKEPKK